MLHVVIIMSVYVVCMQERVILKASIPLCILHNQSFANNNMSSKLFSWPKNGATLKVGPAQRFGSQTLFLSADDLADLT